MKTCIKVIKTCVHLKASPTSPGEVPGMPGGAPDPVPGPAGVPHERDPAAVPGAAHRDHGRAAGPDQWAGDEALQRVFGESVRRDVRALREGDLRRL